MQEKLYDYCVIRLIPNVSQGEFINIGILVVSLEKKQHKVFLPTTVNSTKVKNWFPNLDGLFLQYIINNLKEFIDNCPSESVIQLLQEACNNNYWSSLQIDEPSMIAYEDEIENTLLYLVDKCLDLRTKPGGSGTGSSFVRSQWREVFRKKHLLGKKVIDRPDLQQPDPFSLPVIVDFQWHSTKDEFIIAYSGDKGIEPGKIALENTLDESKSLFVDVQTLLDNNLGVSVITQPPKNPNGKTLEYFQITEERLKKFRGLRIFSHEESNQRDNLIKLVETGKDLELPMSAD